MNRAMEETVETVSSAHEELCITGLKLRCELEPSPSGHDAGLKLTVGSKMMLVLPHFSQVSPMQEKLKNYSTVLVILQPLRKASVSRLIGTAAPLKRRSEAR